ncbi:MAG TPA: SAM-dependent chlorinase/fluorinase [Blastocatellia bacterium]|nr:SAM-dependent chlorinase/fluorinase [Blastocatellia bacterium]HMV87981.1 SAM-dependent chlorinase/fluorinase [Blastocatellia bacterium]HMX30309.1 SAM-dependent chlorinase/fluorinase [Blastocatellia bacterium]HMY74250.1 SAM-dependent chlorinase/fluorinase [Blastocatellia bacterium]HMZ22839.1 SAM-dependent chlorinase/fluorinase [Blastocatellia bacterium]
MITLLTDFGTADYFIPAVKGVILSINPTIQIIDLTHEIPPQDIAAGAFTLGACYQHFPAGTVHVAVVDPGVGSARRAIIVRAGKWLFVGPDNGLFSYVYRCESQVEVFQIERAEYFRHPVSATFHGRDVFAPVAAWLSRGVQPEAVGQEIQDYVRLEIPQPVKEGFAETDGADFSLSSLSEQTKVRSTAQIIHIDRFGNCITSLTERELPNPPAAARLLLAGREITQFGSHFAQATEKNELFAYLGSAGFWEIALWCDSAAARFGVERGAEVILDLR